MNGKSTRFLLNLLFLLTPCVFSIFINSEVDQALKNPHPSITEDDQTILIPENIEKNILTIFKDDQLDLTSKTADNHTISEDPEDVEQYYNNSELSEKAEGVGQEYNIPTLYEILEDSEKIDHEYDDPKVGRTGRFVKFVFRKNSGLHEDVQNILATTNYLLHATKKTSISKDNVNNVQRAIQNGISVCPLNRPAVEIHGSCYEFFPDKLTFPRARRVCQSFGGDLASVNLQKNFLSEIRRFYPKIAIDGTHYETWLGATRIPGTRNFQWFDGRILFASNARWNEGPRDHNCLILDDVSLAQDLIIDDCDCYNKRAFLCQYDLIKVH